jgi:hypothetical protein
MFATSSSAAIVTDTRAESCLFHRAPTGPGRGDLAFSVSPEGAKRWRRDDAGRSQLLFAGASPRVVYAVDSTGWQVAALKP